MYDTGMRIALLLVLAACASDKAGVSVSPPPAVELDSEGHEAAWTDGVVGPADLTVTSTEEIIVCETWGTVGEVFVLPVGESWKYDNACGSVFGQCEADRRFIRGWEWRIDCREGE